MKRKIKTYLDNVFAARQLHGIAWGPFLIHLIASVKADGGAWAIVSVDEIRKHLGYEKRR